MPADVPGEPEMSDSIPDRIAVTFNMTADDYARCFAVMNRYEYGWTTTLIFVAALFSAIPVALLFRSIGARLSGNPAAADLIGQFSLAAFLLGTIAIIVAAFFARQIAKRKFFLGTPNALASKTAVLDATGITLTGQKSQAMWQWAAVTRFTSESDLLLIWIGRTPVVIPRRSFGSDSACEAAKSFIRARLTAVHPD
jgi:hypothetical protein